MDRDALVLWHRQGVAIGAAAALPCAPMPTPTDSFEMAVLAASICLGSRNPATAGALCASAYGAILATPWGQRQAGWSRDFARGARVGAEMISENKKPRRILLEDFLRGAADAIAASPSPRSESRLAELRQGQSIYSIEAGGLEVIDDAPFLALLEALDISTAALPASRQTPRRPAL